MLLTNLVLTSYRSGMEEHVIVRGKVAGVICYAGATRIVHDVTLFYRDFRIVPDPLLFEEVAFVNDARQLLLHRTKLCDIYGYFYNN